MNIVKFLERASSYGEDARACECERIFMIYPLLSNGGISNAYSWHLQAWSTFHLAIIYVKIIVSNDCST